MRHDRRIGILFSNFANTAGGKFDVHIASASPQIHLTPCALHHPRAKVLIGHEKSVSVSWGGVHDLVRVTTCANHVSQRFDASTAVDVRDYVVIFISVLFEELRQLVRWTRLRKRATGIEVR